MAKTILLLILTLVALPILVLNYGEPLHPEQWSMLKAMFWLMLSVAFLSFMVSELSRNYSQTDKLWSIMPIIYTWYVAYGNNWEPRLVLMAALVAVWGLRLSYNFWRRGGYHWLPWKGEEDYRWRVLRQVPLLKGRFRWGLFNLIFISFYQHALILLFTLPAVAAVTPVSQPLGIWDFVLAMMMLALIVFETIADQQQYNFQKAKHQNIAAGKDLNYEQQDGFCKTGLWSLVRHPNYAAEQGIWLLFYGFSMVASGQWINWSLMGAMLLLLLFQGSSDFSEKISAGKYPAYTAYQKRVGRFLPKLFAK